MLELLAMWALVEVLGLLCLPLTFTVFHNLPDRGWAFSKALGMAVFAFVVWLPLMCFHILPFSQLFIFGVALVLLALSILGFTRSYREILKMVRLHQSYVLVTELIFFGMVFLLGWLRSYGPDIYSFEMFMDEGFIASIMRSPHFPPNDMWYAGQGINYYYYAHYMIALLAKFLGQSPSIAFNTGICVFFGLCASNLFGVTCNIVAWASHLRARAQGRAELPSLRKVIPFGLLAFLMALIFGNLASTRQWWLLHDGGDLYGRWFGPSRVIKLEVVEGGVKKMFDATINEFPAFSFLLSCFHAHVLALAFTILAIGVAFNILLSAGKGLAVFGRGWRFGLTLVCSALVLGGLFVMNGWDYPTYLGLTLICLGCQQWLVHRARVSLRLILNFVLPAACLGGLSYLLFVPFYQSFVSPAQGIGLVPPDMRSLLGDELLIYGLFAFLFLSLLLASVLKRPLFDRFSVPIDPPEGALSPATLSTSTFATFDFPIATKALHKKQAYAVEEHHGSSGEVMVATAPEEEDANANEDTLTTLANRFIIPLAAIAYLVLCLVLLRFIPGSATLVVGSSFALFGTLLLFYHLRNRAHAFTLLLGAAAFALVALCELFFLRDSFADSPYERMNTVFKFYFQAWVLLSVSCAAGLYFIIDAFRPVTTDLFGFRWGQRVVVSLWSILLLLLVGASMFYPLTAPQARYAQSDPVTGQPTMIRTNSLDGLEYLKNCNHCGYNTAGDYAAIRWLNEHVQGDPVIIESMKDDYSFYARISAFTGLPTPMGWWYHEYQWRVNWIKDPARNVDFQRRGSDINQIYTLPDSAAVLSLMARYHAEYLYVGVLEQQTYPNVDLHRFASFMQVVYNANGVTIYKVR